MNRRSLLKSALALFAVAVLPIAKRAEAATTHQVNIKGFRFEPETLTVKVGDTITFTNLDGAPHTATSQSRTWDSGKLKKGESADIDVTADMTKDYFCRFHPSMKGKLNIS